TVPRPPATMATAEVLAHRAIPAKRTRRKNPAPMAIWALRQDVLAWPVAIWWQRSRRAGVAAQSWGRPRGPRRPASPAGGWLWPGSRSGLITTVVPVLH